MRGPRPFKHTNTHIHIHTLKRVCVCVCACAQTHTPLHTNPISRAHSHTNTTHTTQTRGSKNVSICTRLIFKSCLENKPEQRRNSITQKKCSNVSHRTLAEAAPTPHKHSRSHTHQPPQLRSHATKTTKPQNHKHTYTQLCTNAQARIAHNQRTLACIAGWLPSSLVWWQPPMLSIVMCFISRAR